MRNAYWAVVLCTALTHRQQSWLRRSPRPLRQKMRLTSKSRRSSSQISSARDGCTTRRSAAQKLTTIATARQIDLHNQTGIVFEPGVGLAALQRQTETAAHRRGRRTWTSMK